MTNLEDNIIDKIKYQQTHRIHCEVLNPELPYKNPPALYISQNEHIPEFANKLDVKISVSGEQSLSLRPWLGGFENIKNLEAIKFSYLRFDFSDIVAQEFQHLLKAQLKKKSDGGEFVPVPGTFVRCSKAQEKEGIITQLFDADQDENSVWIFILELEEGKKKKSLNAFLDLEKMNHKTQSVFIESKKLDIDVARDGLILSKNDILLVEFDSIITFVRPSLRYLDVSWKESDENSNRILTQCPIMTMRPSYFVEPPFPLNIFWLHNHNVAFISKSDPQRPIEIDNELSFAIVNKGLLPLQLDCRDDILEQPYFELVFLGGTGTGDVTEKKYVKDIQLEIEDDTYGDKWTHHKMIQGPVVTWRIQPRLYENGVRNKSILGIEEKGVITFSIKQLRVYGDPGVSMLYLKYYNIPDFDDNQIVLTIEKKEASGSIPASGFGKEYLKILSKNDASKNQSSNYITPPLRWEIMNHNDKLETRVILGNKVGIGSEKTPETTLDVEGDVHVSGGIQINNKSECKGDLIVGTAKDKAKLTINGDVQINGFQQVGYTATCNFMFLLGDNDLNNLKKKGDTLIRRIRVNEGDWIVRMSINIITQHCTAGGEYILSMHHGQVSIQSFNLYQDTTEPGVTLRIREIRYKTNFIEIVLFGDKTDPGWTRILVRMETFRILPELVPSV